MRDDRENGTAGGGLVKLLKPVGPVAEAFGRSRAFIAGIMGPVGGGKTTECIAKGLRVGMAQKAVFDPTRRLAGQDGGFVKKCRGVVVRDTYPNLDRTVIKSWQQWFRDPSGKLIGSWSGEAPRRHSFTVNIGRPGTKGFYQLDMEVIFTAIGEHAVEDVLRGLEVTWIWLNEWDLLPREILEVGVGRLGRYPSVVETGVPCVFSQMFGDFNAPEEDNHLYDLFVDRKVDTGLAEALQAELGDQPLIEFFRQPGAREAGAENIANLPPGYYAKQLLAMARSPDKIARLIDNKWGAVRSGMPVYPEFSDQLHVAPEKLTPIPGVPLRIAMDAGLTPAALIAQHNSLGQTLVLAELATFLEEGDQLASVGPTAFGEALADLLASRFPGFAVEFATVDPAAAQGTDGSGNEMTWLQIAAKVSKLRIRPAPVPNNSLDVRLEAVRRPLRRLVEGGRPSLLISPECRVLRRGFNSGYVYRRTALAGSDSRYENKPVKNQYSHVHDALQYLMVASGEGRIVGDGGVFEKRANARVVVNAGYDPFA